MFFKNNIFLILTTLVSNDIPEKEYGVAHRFFSGKGGFGEAADRTRRFGQRSKPEGLHALVHGSSE